MSSAAAQANKLSGVVVTLHPTEETVELNDQNSWKHTFSNLPVYDSEGNVINYTVTESAKTGEETKFGYYDQSIVGGVITNTFNPEKVTETTKLDVEKDFANMSSAAAQANKLSGVVVTLHPTEETVELNDQNSWKHTFSNLPVYDSEGNVINYTVTESAKSGEETKFGYYDQSIVGGVITNTFNPEKVTDKTGSVTVQKQWEGVPENAGTLTATIELLRNGESMNPPVKTTITGNNSYTFSNLDKYDSNGNEYEYTVREEAVNGYEANYEKTENGYKITNTNVVDITKGVAELRGEEDKPNSQVFTEIADLSNVRYEVGDTVWYSITVTNNGTVDQKGVTVTDILNAGLDYGNENRIGNPQTRPQQGEVSYNQNTRTITWTTDLDAGASKTLYIKTTINEAAVSGEPYDSETTGTEASWWETDPNNNIYEKINGQSAKARLFIRLDGQVQENDENADQDTKKYTECVATVNLTRKNLSESNVPTNDNNAIRIGTSNTPETVEEFAALNNRIFQYIVNGTSLDAIANNINNGNYTYNGNKITFDPDTQMIVCYVMKYYGDDGYHIDAVIRDKAEVRVDLYKLGNTAAVVNGETSNNVEITVIETTEIAKPNISVEKTQEIQGGKTTVEQGDTITYKITATNTGKAAGNVTIRDKKPENTELLNDGVVTVKQTPIDGGRTTTLTPTNMTVLSSEEGYTIEVPAGTKVELSFTVSANGYAGEDITNTADYKKDGEEKFTPTETVETALEDSMDLVTSRTVQKAEPQKVILLLDYSGSMDKPVNGYGKSKKSSMEDAVESFLDVFLPEGTKNEVMVIPYGSETNKGTLEYTSSAQDVKNFLAWKSAEGGTNIHAALEDALEYVDRDTTVILMTDGEPTFYRMYWNGHYIGTGGNGSHYVDTGIRDAADNIKEKYPDDPTKIYTIGFGISDLNNPSSQMARLMNDIASPANGDEKYCYSSNNEEELTEVFSSIAKTITETENAAPEPKQSVDGIITLEGIEAGQNVELYTKYVTDRDGNVDEENSTLYNGRPYTWNEFLNLTVTTESEERINLVTYNEEDKTLTFNLGAFMEYNQIAKDQKFTIRFVDPNAQAKLSSANILSLAINAIADDTINDETVSTYEDKFNEVEANKTEATKPADTKIENVETTTPDTDKETEVVEDNKENATEGTTTDEGNTTTEEKPAEQPTESETTTGTESVEQDTTSNINEQSAE